MATVKTKTKAPTGVKITPYGDMYTCSWKIADADYDDGEQLQYRTKFQSTWSSWINIPNIGKKTTSKNVVKIDKRDCRPIKNGGRYFTRLEVRVRGNRKAYTVTKNKKKTTYSPDVSDWTTIFWTNYAPVAPTVSAEFSSEQDNVTKFSWSANQPNEHYIFSNCELQTVLLKNYDGDISKAAGWTGTQIVGQSGSTTYVENTDILKDASYTRGFRIRARGPAGDSAWAYAKHVYALPSKSTSVTASGKSNGALGMTITVRWQSAFPASRPIDKTTVQYCIVVPTSSLGCPVDASWTDISTISDTSGYDGTSFSLDDIIDENHALFIRVNNHHDRKITYGSPVLVKGFNLKLSRSTISSLQDSVGSDLARARVTVTDIPEVQGTYIIVYKEEKKAGETSYSKTPVGYIPAGQTSATLAHWPSDSTTSVRWSVQAFCGGTVTPSAAKVGTYDITKYSVNGAAMSSDEVYWEVVNAINNVRLSSVKGDTILVEWDWPFNSTMDEVELSWSDDENAWYSTNQPQTYRITNTTAGRWYIVGLESGVTWYIRLRGINVDENSEIVGPWSPIVGLNLSSVPMSPEISIPPESIIQPGEVIKLSWIYRSENTSDQQEAADIRLATMNNDQGTGTTDATPSFTPGITSLTTDTTPVAGKSYYTRTADNKYIKVTDVEGKNPAQEGWYEWDQTNIANAQTESSVDLDSAALGWEEGHTYFLTVRTKSKSGQYSEWAYPVSVGVANPLNISLSSSSLVEETVIHDPTAEIIPVHEDETEEDGTRVVIDTITDEYKELPTTTNLLKEMPLEVTVTGAGTDGTTTVSVVRNGAYFLNKPDGDIFTGYDGELVCSATQKGEEPITFTNNELLMNFDDGADYKIVATVEDNVGQVATAELPFTVRWTHQALIPDVTCELIPDEFASKITPIAPDGTEEGDTFDIYRLSVDKPELIVKDGIFGTTYVDPYPSIGEMGGHRIVFKTSNGDYITETNELAWVDTRGDVGDLLETEYSIIDFGTDRVNLLYNINLTNQWSKDFKETKYLGGSVQGDWNPAVSRTGSVNTVSVITADQETIIAMRKLAAYSGVCHIRTRDGSSYACDVQVSDTMNYDSYELVSYSLSITRVDSERMDGMTMAEWEEIHQEE